MRADELRGKRVAIWGYGREGRAALQFLRERGVDATVLDDGAIEADAPLITGRAAIAAAIGGFDAVVKSPGISLYDPLICDAKERGVRFTSLLNLWFADRPLCRTTCVTGTKGKSTTTALITHILRGAGRNAMAAGNIGVPVTELPAAGLDVAVIEVSSYQAADFDGLCDVAVLTALSQEHLDWHGSVAVYQRDKLNLLRHARHCLIAEGALPIVATTPRLDGLDYATFAPGPESGVANGYLRRRHNLSNLAGALGVAELFGVDRAVGLRAAESFLPLPHRQQEIGRANGLLFVDDSISTTPEAAIAALDVYSGNAVTLIIGGHDRGIDYEALLSRLRNTPPCAVITIGASGQRLFTELGGVDFVHRAASMGEAVDMAKAITPDGGVVLLSPAAPSYGTYRSFIERGEDFAHCAGLTVMDARNS
jgi:UDP-N-acetylmuramoylalanine--D-glutamate ligase